jgi:hypothetical protein
MKMLSLKIFAEPTNKLLAMANPVTNECVTFSDYVSCYIDVGDTRTSYLRVLISDMKAGESRRYSCRVNSFDSYGDPVSATWYITVERQREYVGEKVKLMLFSMCYCV